MCLNSHFNDLNTLPRQTNNIPLTQYMHNLKDHHYTCDVFVIRGYEYHWRVKGKVLVTKR